MIFSNRANFERIENGRQSLMEKLTQLAVESYELKNEKLTGTIAPFVNFGLSGFQFTE